MRARKSASRTRAFQAPRPGGTRVQEARSVPRTRPRGRPRRRHSGIHRQRPPDQAGQTRSDHNARPSPLAPRKTKGDVEDVARAPKRKTNERPEPDIADRNPTAPELPSPDREKKKEPAQRQEPQTGANRPAQSPGPNELLGICLNEFFCHGPTSGALQARIHLEPGYKVKGARNPARHATSSSRNPRDVGG